VLAALAITVVLVELVVRGVVGLGWVRTAPVLTEHEGSVRLHPRYGFVLHPGVYDGKHINRWGLRGPDFEEAKRPGCVRILMIGDSTTFGTGVRDEAAYPEVVRRLLAGWHPQRCIEVINAGVASYHSYQQLLRTRDLYVRLQPDVVAICLGWNDLAHRLMMGDAFVPEDVTVTPSYLIELRPGRRAWLQRAAAWRLTRSTVGRWRFARGLKRLAADPHPEAVLAPAEQALVRHVTGIVEAVQPAGARVVLLRQPWLLREDRLADELAQLRRMRLPRKMARGLDGVSPRASYPARAARALAPLSRREGVQTLDCASAFAAVPLEGRVALFDDLLHPNEAGYALLGRCLADALEPLVAASSSAPAPCTGPGPVR
jgi:lysophospholipase L1-like esterase